MSAIQIDNPLIENYLAQFDCFSPEEQQIVFTQLRQKRGDIADGGIRAQQRSKVYTEQTEEERKAAAKKFFDSWDGLLKDAPNMTAEEIRAERLERKYGK